MGIFFGSPKINGVEFDIDSKDPDSDSKDQMSDTLKHLLERTESMLQIIEDYKGCQELARAAMTTPNQENEKAAFEGLLTCVDQIQQFNSYSKELGTGFSQLLEYLAENTGDKNIAHLDQKPYLAKQLGDMIDFALHFDNIRMLRPNLSNDFSYYRRLLPKFNHHEGIKVKEDEASGMVMFTAEHIPMTRILIKSAEKSLNNNPVITLVLSTLANSCMLMLKNKKFSDDEINELCARVMAGSIVIYDHVDDIGAFAKKSPIGIKQCVNILKKDFPNNASLMNSLRYSTRTFRDAPTKMQALFD